jgi:hypothetical protein
MRSKILWKQEVCLSSFTDTLVCVFVPFSAHILHYRWQFTTRFQTLLLAIQRDGTGSCLYHLSPPYVPLPFAAYEGNGLGLLTLN